MSELKSSIRPQRSAQKLDCNTVFGWLGRDGKALCNQHGNPEFTPLLNPAYAQQQRLRQYKQRRLNLAASKVNGRCDCAVSVTLERRRMGFALYAGSARLITPHAIKNLSSELSMSLDSPHCARKSNP